MAACVDSVDEWLVDNCCRGEEAADQCRKRTRCECRPAAAKADNGDKGCPTEVDAWSRSECARQVQPPPQRQKKDHTEPTDSCISIVTTPAKPVTVVVCDGRCPVNVKDHGGWCADTAVVPATPAPTPSPVSGRPCRLCGARRWPAVSAAPVGRWAKSAIGWLWGKKSYYVVATASFLAGAYLEDYRSCLYAGPDFCRGD